MFSNVIAAQQWSLCLWTLHLNVAQVAFSRKRFVPAEPLADLLQIL